MAHPRGEEDLERLLEWCSGAGIAAIPFGGGTSVCGGVTPDVGPGYNGAVSIDMGALDRLLELDEVSLSANIEAGATGPGLEAQLAEHGLTLRHFPQSFEYSTLGGWIATRAAGHFASIWTHIEDFVESVRAITPAGAWESRRLPGSGAGVSPDRMLVGSEGIARGHHPRLGSCPAAALGTAPRRGCASRASCEAPSACRAISQAGLHPANCRLLDPGEAGLTMAGDGSHALLVLGFESTDHPVEEAMDRALAICAEHGGSVAPRREGPGGDAVGSWRGAFVGAPYVRDLLVSMGVVSARPSRRRSPGSASRRSTSA